MYKKAIITAAVLAFCVAGFASVAGATAISSGLNWLKSQQAADGRWSGVETNDYYSTTATLEVIAILEPSSPEYSPGLQWLNTQDIAPVDYLSKRIIAIKQAGGDPASDIQNLLTYRNASGNWGTARGFDNNILDTLDTTLALLALKSANYSDTTVINSAIIYLINNQNTDGGWAFRQAQGDETCESNVYMTAMVLDALAQFKSTYNLQTLINNAAAYLLAHQNTDGSFDSSPSNVYETALSLMALIDSGQGQAQPLQSAVNYLLTTEAADGSWNQDPYSTALALRALANVKPNLSIASTDMSFSNPMPQSGTEVTITANIRNSGLDSASNVTVRFFSGDPSAGGVQIGTDQVIPLLAAGTSSLVTVSNTFTTTGSKTIYVLADPDNQISETNETDNSASARLWAATPPDLAVFSEDIKPSTFVPVSGMPFTLEYTIRNLGESAADGFDVSIYDGQPTGLPLQTINFSGIGGTELRTGTIGVTLTGNGSHTLYLVADTGNTVTELTETNNSAFITVEVGGTQTGADMAINSMDIATTPSRPHEGETVAITAKFRNEGTEPADNFTVEIFDGAPESGGRLIHSEARTLFPGEEQTISANWLPSSGIHDIYVVLDRANQLIEVNETNNRASTRVMTDMVDIALSATDLTFNPSHPVSGDSVALTMTVHNQGIRDTGVFNLTLYNGDPNGVGAPPATPLQTFQIANIAGDGSATLTYTFTASPQTYRFYAVADTENVVTEMYEDNNAAIRSLKIKAPGEIVGPDLIPLKIDLTGTATDPQTLAISGTAHVTFQNNGDDKITTPFNVLIFEDTDLDGRYTTGIDNAVGAGTNTLTLWPEGANIVDVPVSGTVKFLKSPLYAFVDSGDDILEQDDSNNLLVSCKEPGRAYEFDRAGGEVEMETASNLLQCRLCSCSTSNCQPHR